MTPERWSEIQMIFAAVVETRIEDRDARIRELCRGDEELVREVSSLIAADAEASARILAAAAQPAKPVPVGVRVGEYVIESLIGRGGMGTVYGGVHPVIGKQVAIKVLDARLASSDGIVERFVREARAVNKIRHQNIIDIFAFGYSPELGHYFVMPRLTGETLGARIERAPLSLAELLPIIEQIADALDAAHRTGVLHRDLKPDNVFLVDGRRGGVTVQLLDFGIAKLLDGDASVTRSGTQMGTPLFMSPEQWDAAPVDRRTDIYALGVMVHFALTGRFPFESSSPVALMNMHANRPPTPASEHGAPPAVDPLIARALAKSRDERYDTAGQLYAELLAIAPLAGATTPPSAHAARPAITTLSGSSGASVQPASSRGRRLLAVGGLLTAGALVTIAAATFGRRGGEPSTGGGELARDADTFVPPAEAATPSPSLVTDASITDAGVQPPRLPRDAARRPPRPAFDASVRDAAAVPGDAAVPRDAEVLRIDASEWGTTINPFPSQP
jgi:serine/threonine-protein kinase